MMPLIEELSKGWRAWAAAGLLAALAGLAGVFTLPVLDRDEARYAQATAQMLQTGDFVRITFLDEDRNKKPVGIHWMQSAAVALTTGEAAREIWAYRLPSLLGAVLAAIAAALMAGRLLGARAGLYAGSLFGVTVLLGTEAGIAKTDAMLAGATAFALYALTRLRQAPGDALAERRRWAVIVWAFTGLGILIKGPVTPMAVGLGALALTLWEARAGRSDGGYWPALKRCALWLRPLAVWPGPVLAALIVLPWLISVQIATDGAFLREALGDDLGPKMISGDEGHWGPPGYHLLALALTLFPAAFFLPAGIAAAMRALKAGGESALAARALIAFSLPVWIVFELLPTKLPHYVLVAFPAMAGLCAWGVVEWARTRAVWRWTGAALSLLGASIWAAALGYVTVTHEGSVVLLAGGLAAIFALLALKLIAGLRGSGAAALMAALALGLVWHSAGRGVILPSTNLSPAYFAAQLAKTADLRPAGAPVISTYTEPSLVFSLGGEVRLTDIGPLTEDWLAPQGDAGQTLSPAFLTQGPALVVIDHSRLPREGEALDAALTLIALLEAAACRTGEVSGYNYSRGRDVRLTLHRTGPCE
ncbi:glycosyltransferase family 39 protein [Alkalicaulis satelles]|uniref:Glycosyltransferase family 39 protein n=1 Tax=Alkalicaulis satelles TaxID=2609175 RepID=A0A5M6ZMA9_9PROT|nr:glycosyltransferase family 39 protein [Alkalicaulis satelles]KAA5805450.1 glycosyltransferase family 39 protein [Alkalicaulis satelles]